LIFLSGTPFEPDLAGIIATILVKAYLFVGAILKILKKVINSQDTIF
jgi:hypothetical protein